MSVSIVKANLVNIDTKVKEALELIRYTPKKKRLFIKPNIVAAYPPASGIVTHPRVVEALIKYFWGYEIFIGEGVAVGADFKDVLEVTGYRRLGKKYDIPIMNLDYCDRYDVPWKYGVLSLPKILEEYEYIDVPSMKTHKQTTVSLGMKNQKGLLSPRQKRWFHYEGLEQLSELIKELSNIISPNLTLVDALYCVEGEGPVVYSKTKRMDLIIAGQDMIEVDNVCCQIMGIDARTVRHIPYRDNVETLGASVESVKADFMLPQTTYYNMYNLYYQYNYSCSGCIFSTKKAMEFYWRHPFKFLKRLIRGDFEVIAGHKPSLPKKSDNAICIGDCTKLFAQEYNMPHVEGCPPDPKQIFDKIN
jgi:uncharacterized protein (DUF362 family)